MTLNPLWETPKNVEPCSCAVDWPTVLIELFLIFPFAHAQISKYCSFHYAVLYVHFNNFSCCFSSHQVVILFSLGTTFVQEFVFQNHIVRGLILSQKGISSVAPFLPIFCHLSHHQRVVLTRARQFYFFVFFLPSSSFP